jgi:hypothetical protein
VAGEFLEEIRNDEVKREHWLEQREWDGMNLKGLRPGEDYGRKTMGMTYREQANLETRSWKNSSNPNHCEW